MSEKPKEKLIKNADQIYSRKGRSRGRKGGHGESRNGSEGKEGGNKGRVEAREIERMEEERDGCLNERL